MAHGEALRELGVTIRKLRRARKLTQRVLAELVGAHFNTLKRVESGKGNPSVKLLLDLAEELGVTLTDLLGRKR